MKIMTPKYEAKELFDNFLKLADSSVNKEIIDAFGDTKYKGSKFLALFRFAKKYRAKQCSLISINETIQTLHKVNMSTTPWINNEIEYLKEVKQEIQKL